MLIYGLLHTIPSWISAWEQLGKAAEARSVVSLGFCFTLPQDPAWCWVCVPQSWGSSATGIQPGGMIGLCLCTPSFVRVQEEVLGAEQGFLCGCLLGMDTQCSESGEQSTPVPSARSPNLLSHSASNPGRISLFFFSPKSCQLRLLASVKAAILIPPAEEE